MSSTRKERLRAWILEHGKRVDPAELTDDTPLLEKRILTSLQLADLLLFLEELRDAPVEIESLTGASFRDLGSMVKAFLPEEAAHV
jgi:acyl carrier protein